MTLADFQQELIDRGIVKVCQGSARRTYIMGDHVVKLPIAGQIAHEIIAECGMIGRDFCTSGEEWAESQMMLEIARSEDSTFPYPIANMIYFRLADDSIIIVMERVEIDLADMPYSLARKYCKQYAWLESFDKIDGYQCGFTKDGRLVCYDVGY